MFLLAPFEALDGWNRRRWFLDEWFGFVNSRMIIRGIESLNDCTSVNLASGWLKYKKQFSAAESLTTTVYHFGFSEISGDMQSYAFRSVDEFVVDPLPYGIAVKPECEVPPGYEFPTDFKALMQEQRRLQSLLPDGQRVYIGGEIIIHHLTKPGCYIHVQDKFDDYGSVEKSIFNRVSSLGDGSRK